MESTLSSQESSRPQISVIIVASAGIPLEGAIHSVTSWADEVIVVAPGELKIPAGVRHVVLDENVDSGRLVSFVEVTLLAFPIHDWVFVIYSDERVSARLAAALQSFTIQPSSVRSASIRCELEFLGRRISHGGRYPRNEVRLVRRSELELLGSLYSADIALKGDLVQVAPLGLNRWVRSCQIRASRQTASELAELSSKRSPARHMLAALAHFLGVFILRGGFLDGAAGLIYHFMRECWFPFYAGALVLEARSRRRAPDASSSLSSSIPVPSSSMSTSHDIAPDSSNPQGSLSVIILTFNEEKNLPFVLQSVAPVAAEIIVVDSFSTDRTVEIARRFGARVVQHAFENQARQFNWALDNVAIKSEWVLRLDADEFLLPGLAEEISHELAGFSPEVTGIFLRRKVYAFGRWIKHGDFYPRWFVRIFRKGCGRYEDVTEEHIVLSRGETRRFVNDFADFNRNGLDYWTEKHIGWSLGEMRDTKAMTSGSLPEGTVERRLFGTQEQRVRWLKTHIYARFPLFVRPFAYFVYRYIFRLGFLDGAEGLAFHFLQGCWYRFLVDANIYESTHTAGPVTDDKLRPADPE